MIKGDRVRHRHFKWEGSIVREVEPPFAPVYIRWDKMAGITFHAQGDLKVIPPLQQLAECAE